MSSPGHFDDEDMSKRKVFLIIGPATVLHNWMDELHTWGYFAVGKYHGTHKANTIADLRQHRLDIVVTTFATCRDHIMSSPGHFDDEDMSKRKVFLIIGPATVLHNWMDELHTWGYFAVGKYHGTHKANTIADLRQHRLDIVVTTFATCRDHIKEINSFHWDAIFADEAHKIKGLKAEVTKALRSLCCRRRFALTGTPLQNALWELWSILDWTNPGCLGDLSSFKKRYIETIELGQKQDATKRELAEARKAQQDLEAKRNKYTLRRTKDIIADELPRKDELIVHCEPTKLQSAIYRSFLECSDVVRILYDNELCDCDSGLVRGNCCYKVANSQPKKKGLVLTYMHLLLKTANHVALLLPEHTDNDKQKEYGAAICRQVLASSGDVLQHDDSPMLRVLADPKYSGKMKVLHGLLSAFWKERSKVLVFSYSTRLLNIVEQYVMGLGHDYRRLDGTTNQSKRGQIVAEFNRDHNIFVFLISTLVGGVGLNLTGANRVVIFDPNWNPTNDLQAQDRAFRIGQQRDVKVYRLISSGMIEENIYLRQIYKQQLSGVGLGSENARRYFQAVRSKPDQCGELFGIANMFRLRDNSDTSLTQQILMRNEQIESGLRGYQMSNYIKPQTETHDQSERRSSEEDANSSCEEGSEREPGDSEESSIDDDDDKIRIKSRSPCKRHRQILRDDSNDDSCSDDNNIHPTTSSHVANPARPKLRKLDSSGPVVSSPTSAVESGVEVSTGKTKHGSPIDDVLAQCGVRYVHDNRTVIGASRAEDHMTRCAMEAVFDEHVDSQLPARVCQPYTADQEDNEAECCRPERKSTRRSRKQKAVSPSVILGDTHILIGQTPNAIRLQQMSKLCEWLQEAHQVSLARRILSSSFEERQRILRDFYVHQDPRLGKVLEQQAIVNPKENGMEKTKDSREWHAKSKPLQRRPLRRKSLSSKGCYYTDDTSIERGGTAPVTSTTRQDPTTSNHRQIKRNIRIDHSSPPLTSSKPCTISRVPDTGVSNTVIDVRLKEQHDSHETDLDAMLNEIFGLEAPPPQSPHKRSPQKPRKVARTETPSVRTDNPLDIVNDIFFDEAPLVRTKSAPKRKSLANVADSTVRSFANSSRVSPY